MSTAFTDIYDVFLSQISDPIFVQNDSDDALKYRYLLNSIPKFKRCKSDLSSRSSTEFDANLNDEEIMILGTLMVIEYLNPLIISIENIKQFMSSKDFRLTSQAAHLETLRTLREEKKKEVDRMIVDYTYNNGKLDELI